MINTFELYVKTRCPWCVTAQEWLDTRGYEYELIDVLADRADYDKMIALSGQRYTPTLVINGDQVLADFGPEELEPFLKKLSLAP